MPERFQRESKNKLPDLSSWLASERPIGVPEGRAFDARALRIKSPDEFEGLSKKEQLLYFAWFASIAADSHNAGSKLFQLDEQNSSVKLFVNRYYVLGASDAVGRQAIISAGASIENMVRAARSYGKEALVEITNDNAREFYPLQEMASNAEIAKPLARITFTDGEKDSFDPIDLEVMLKRKVFRGQFDTRHKLDSDTTSVLRTIFKSHPAITTKVLTDGMALSLFSRFQQIAMKTVLERENFRNELGEYFHSNTDNETLRGMRAREFALYHEAGERMARALKKDAPAEERLRADEILGFARAEKERVQESTAVVFLSTDDSIESRIEAGRMYEEIALDLLKRTPSLYTSVHAAVSEVPVIADNKLAQTWFGNQRPTVIFRIGKPLRSQDVNISHSSRVPISELLIEDQSQQV